MRQFVGTGESALYRVSVVPTRLLLRGAQNDSAMCGTAGALSLTVGGLGLRRGGQVGADLRTLGSGRQCGRQARVDANLFQLLPKITLSGHWSE